MISPSFFQRELDRLPGKKVVTSNRVFIVCPFHPDTKPSGAVSLDTTRPRWIGGYKCWGCGKYCSWDELADKLGMKRLDGKNTMPKKAGYVDMSDMKNRLFPEDKDSIKDYDFFDMQDPKWRGFKKEFLEKFEVKLAFHEKTERFYMWFPVIVKDKQVGYFRALMKPIDGLPSYFNKPGEWVKRKGLFPFDQAILMMKRMKLKTVFLVEGQRDAVRLLRLGIPAVSILGTQNWTNMKLTLLETVGVERIVLMMDGDKAGRKATIKLAPQIRKMIDLKVARLWKVARKMKLKKIDPGDAPKKVLLKYKEWLI